MTGTLHLVGVGPGDPELLTLKAARLLAAVPVVAYPVTGEGEAFALSIAERHINSNAERMPIDIPMTVKLPNGEFAPKDAIYVQAAAAIEEHLEAGRDVAYLCEGDPLFYGSANYLLSILLDKRRVSVVPGITSITAAAAAIPFPLVGRWESFTVLTAPWPDKDLRSVLEAAGSVAIIKVGRHFDRVRAVLDATRRAEGSWLVEYATGDRQRIERVRDAAPGPRPYFSVILSFSGAEYWL